MIKIAPSLLAADFTKLGSEVESLNTTQANMLHLDIMDGIFVPNISFGYDIVKQIRPISSLIFDVHLMISNASKYIDKFADAGANSITVHYEAVDDVEAIINYIHSKGLRAAVSVKPATPIESIAQYLPLMDMLLIMSVEPGFGGQKYIASSTEKIQCARRIISDKGLRTSIQVDGGVNASNVAEVYKAGADIAVAGTAVFGKADRNAAVNDLMERTL